MGPHKILGLLRQGQQSIKGSTGPFWEQTCLWPHRSHTPGGGLASQSLVEYLVYSRWFGQASCLLQVDEEGNLSKIHEDLKNLKHILTIKNPFLWSSLHYKVNQRSYYPEGGFRWKMVNRPQTFITYSTQNPASIKANAWQGIQDKWIKRGSISISAISVTFWKSESG